MHHALTQVLKLVFIRNPSGHKNENKVSMKQYHCDENSEVFFSGARCKNDLHMVQLMPLPPPSSPASLKSGLVFTFLVLATPVVLEKRPLNRCLSEE